MSEILDGERGESAESLRLLYVVHGFPPDTWAGTEVYTLELALEMQRRGHQVFVVARTPPEDGEADWTVRTTEFSGLPVFRIARHVDDLPIGESYRPAAARPVFEELLDRIRPQLVHFQHLLHLSVDWIEIAREAGLPTVYTAHDYWAVCARVQLQRTDGVLCRDNQRLGCFPCIKDKTPALVPAARVIFPLMNPLVDLLDRSSHKGRRLSRFTRSWIDLRERQEYIMSCFGGVDLTIAPSRFLRSVLVSSGGFDPERIIHSDYGMRAAGADASQPKPPRMGGPRFGFIGSLVEHKGIAVLLRAMRRLRRLDCRLEVFGDFRPEEDDYHASLTELAAGVPVSFRGRFDNDRLAEVFREIDVLVVPSTWFENSPLVIHEAFLHRTPVVTSDIGGMAELVRDGVDGLHFRAADERALAKALRRLVDERELIAELSRDFPSYKTPEEDAREMEARYSALLR